MVRPLSVVFRARIFGFVLLDLELELQNVWVSNNPFITEWTYSPTHICLPDTPGYSATYHRPRSIPHHGPQCLWWAQPRPCHTVTPLSFHRPWRLTYFWCILWTSLSRSCLDQPGCSSIYNISNIFYFCLKDFKFK